MIDLKNFRENPEAYQESASRRGLDVPIDELLKLDQQRVALIQEVDDLRSQLNIKGKPGQDELAKLQTTKADLESKEPQLRQLEQRFNDLLLSMPNLLAPGTPEGGEEANQEERSWGGAPKPDYAVKDHLEYMEERGWVDFERGAKVAGSKYYYLVGQAARLERALLQLAWEMAEKEDFIPVTVPHLVNTQVASGTGFAPRGPEQQIYSIEDEDLHLIATAELPLTGLHAAEILDFHSLPLRYAACSPSYRKEAGAYGKHSKGLYRVHQFNKLELYIYCQENESDDWLEKLVKLEEKITQALEIPYRVTRTAAGDMGLPHYKKYDLEYWSPSENAYRELTSASNCTDFQARRLEIRTKNQAGKNVPVHTLNATALATSRALVALVENHQQSDGRLKLPLSLAQYYGEEAL